MTSIKDVNGRIIAVSGIAQDRTELMNAQEMIIQSEKLSLVGQLAAGIAHEIRNPLTSLKGFLKLLSNDSKCNKKYLEIMEQELGRIEQIVNEFLITSKPRRPSFETGNLHELVSEVIALLEAQTHMNNIEVVTSFEANTPMVSCDKSQLKQVFLNVMKNAIESMPKGGGCTSRQYGATKI